MKIYHNSRCRKSRTGLQYLEEKGIKPEIIQYLKDAPFTNDSLKSLLEKLGTKPYDIVRTQEADYKQNHKGGNYSDDEWIEILVNNPKLIRRPIIENNDIAVLGDDIKTIDKLL